MKSFKRYQYRRFPTEDGAPANGDYIYPDVTIRFKDGYLNDSADEEGHVLPAIETQDGSHIEHWKNGVLHCEKEPAIVDKNDNYEEWYQEDRPVTGGGNNGRIDDPRGI